MHAYFLDSKSLTLVSGFKRCLGKGLIKRTIVEPGPLKPTGFPIFYQGPSWNLRVLVGLDWSKVFSGVII